MPTKVSDLADRPIFIRVGLHAEKILGISKARQYDLIESGALPPTIRISDRIHGWLACDLENFLRNKGRPA